MQREREKDKFEGKKEGETRTPQSTNSGRNQWRAQAHKEAVNSNQQFVNMKGFGEEKENCGEM